MSIPTFEYPKLLYLLLLLVPLIAWYIFRISRANVSIQISSIIGLEKQKKGLRYYLAHLPFILRCLVLACIIVAIARPRSSSALDNVTTEGIDIMLTIDISSSMLAMDFKPNRIEASKSIATQFISDRVSDRMGLVVFAGESFTQCPLTTDRATLINLMQEVKPNMVEDGTAIGDGLATAVARLKDSEAKSRVVILLTDGENNRGTVSPLTAAEIAQTYKVRVYTIGVGATEGTAPYPMQTIFGTTEIVQQPINIDEDLMKQMADMTGGKYFRANNNSKLADIYRDIDKLEKTKTEVDSFPVYKEEFLPYALAALALLIIEMFLRLFILRRIP